MGSIVSCNSFDYSNAIIVPVIASFDTEGHIIPLYVRIEGESMKVHSSWLKPGFSHSTFQCQVIDNGILKPLILSYHSHEGLWTIPRY